MQEYVNIMECKNCKKDKPISEFYKDKNGYVRKTCKECVIEQTRRNQLLHKEERKKYCQEYHKKHRDKRIKSDEQYRQMKMELKTPCKKCGDTRLYVIDFHHIDPKEKSFNINRKTSKKDFSIIEEEVKKCVCLCRNCHMEFHYLYGQNPENPTEALKEYLEKEIKK